MRESKFEKRKVCQRKYFIKKEREGGTRFKIYLKDTFIRSFVRTLSINIPLSISLSRVILRLEILSRLAEIFLIAHLHSKCTARVLPENYS